MRIVRPGAKNVRLWCAAVVLILARVVLGYLAQWDACNFEVPWTFVLLFSAILGALIIMPATILLRRIGWNTFTGYGVMAFAFSAIILLLPLVFDRPVADPSAVAIVVPSLTYLFMDRVGASLTTAAFGGALWLFAQAGNTTRTPETVVVNRKRDLMTRVAAVIFWLLVIVALARDLSMVGEVFAGGTSLERLYARWSTGREWPRCVPLDEL